MRHFVRAVQMLNCGCVDAMVVVFACGHFYVVLVSVFDKQYMLWAHARRSLELRVLWQRFVSIGTGVGHSDFVFP